MLPPQTNPHQKKQRGSGSPFFRFPRVRTDLGAGTIFGKKCLVSLCGNLPDVDRNLQLRLQTGNSTGRSLRAQWADQSLLCELWDTWHHPVAISVLVACGALSQANVFSLASRETLMNHLNKNNRVRKPPHNLKKQKSRSKLAAT